MRFFLTSLFVLFLGIVLGQDQNYIVREDGLWSTVELHCMPNGNNYSTYHIKFDGDTIIESITYKKAWYTEDETYQSWDFYGFIREDENHRVFLRPPGYNEGKIYDFGVNTGDTITALNQYLNSDTLHFVVTAIDSVQEIDRFRKRITLYEYINLKEEVWIEGIGSLYGVMNSCNNAYGGACGGYEALCYEEDGQLVYQHPDYNTCHYELTVNTDVTRQNMYSVYPNPAKAFLTVDLGVNYQEGKSFNMEIYSFYGKKIFNKTIFDKKNTLLLRSIENGIYLIRIKNKEDSFPPTKLIVD